MKKSNFKKAFALSALMAFVITGSAYANDLDTKDFKNTGTLEGFYSTITVTGLSTILALLVLKK